MHLYLGKVGHFPTAHSWIGLVTMFLIITQLAFGALRQFGFMQDDTSRVYHKFLGLVTYVTSIIVRSFDFVVPSLVHTGSHDHCQ